MQTQLVERLATSDLIHKQSIHTSHRPAPTPSPTVYRTIPLMQGFRTSAPKQAARDTSTIDFFFFPDPPTPPPSNPFSKLRVPLLPDNYSPDRSPNSGHAVEALDEAVPRPEISIIASHPENVAPATISEVVGNDGLDVDIGQLTTGFASAESKEPGLLKELWTGFVDDVLGAKHSAPKVAV